MFGLSLHDESGGVAKVQRSVSIAKRSRGRGFLSMALPMVRRRHFEPPQEETPVSRNYRCRCLEISKKDLGIANMALPAKPAEISQYGLLSMDILGIRE